MNDPDIFVAAELLRVPLLTLAVVFVLIAVRQVGSVTMAIWQVMLGGAIVVLLSGDITPGAALRSINVDVMLFLFGMFVVGQALEESGYLAHLSYKYFKRARSLDALVLMILFGAGILSAFLMNDTLAIIGTPVVLLLARRHGMSAKPLLLALAFGVTIGSVLSPIGNPQNLLIALGGGVPNPFVTFLRYLLVPTMLNLYAAFWVLKLFHMDGWHDAELKHSQEPIRDRQLAALSKISLQIILLLVGLKILLSLLGTGEGFQLTHIALAACLPILVGSPRRWKVLRSIDWQTLAFFAGMFILMEAVWQTGFFQGILSRSGIDIRSAGVILGVSVVVSQFVSNVPMVALSLPILRAAGAGPSEMMALAAGSTIAGNLLILGAASNVIIIQNAERRSGHTVTFWEFTRVGGVLTIVNATVYWLFFLLP
jgi:Na+/H+ antiporter NhaD/arsenite permease-like protein